MSIGKKILLYSALACTVLALAPATTAAANTKVPAVQGGPSGTPPGYVIESTPNIGVPNNTQQFAFQNCPSGTVVLSGGAWIASSSVKTSINSSYPDGDTWVVIVNNFSGASTTFTTYVVCATKPTGYEMRESTAMFNGKGTQASGVENCSHGDVLLGGGVQPETSPASTSVGMTSSYPTSTASWEAAMSNFSNSVDWFMVYAICASALPNYGISSASASDPTGKQVGISVPCPASTAALGGGIQSSNTNTLRIGIKATRPLASGTEWKSGENNDSGSSTTTLTSYAICAT